MSKQTICIAHSPDSDDAFMFYALAKGKIDTGVFEFVHELDDIEALNQVAMEGKYEVTAVSIHAYAYLHERYALLTCGASMGEGYGPILVSSVPFTADQLSEHSIGVPGERTSALLVLKLFQPDFEYRVIPFDQIIPSVQRQEVDAGLVIHEGQLTYLGDGLHKVLDVGEWWLKTTGLPLPLGGNVIRRDFGEDTIHQVSRLIKESIQYGLSHREEALAYALQFGRGLDSGQADEFVGMYVNERTLDYGEDGKKAVQLLLDRGHEAGLIPHRVEVDFI